MADAARITPPVKACTIAQFADRPQRVDVRPNSRSENLPFAARRPTAKFCGDQRNILIRQIGASLAWFVMDFAYYGNTVCSPLVLSAIATKATLISKTLMQLCVLAAAAV